MLVSPLYMTFAVESRGHAVVFACRACAIQFAGVSIAIGINRTDIMNLLLIIELLLMAFCDFCKDSKSSLKNQIKYQISFISNSESLS